ncbi:MAG: hypothetical protein AB8G16_11485 [Gammaproteobacteria bacterium]
MNPTALRVMAQLCCTAILWCSLTTTLAQERATPEFRYQEQWQALTDADDHAAAADLAKTWVNDTKRQFGDGAAETFLPLTFLADSYAASDQNQLAIITYQDAIEVGEIEIGVFARALLDPLVKLSELLKANDQHNEAVTALVRAKDITHRVEGIYNTEQTGIIEKLSDVYLLLNDVRQATREQKLLLSSESREVGYDSPALVPALHRWADFNVKINRRRDARRFLHDAVEILEKAYGPDDIRIAETLKLIAETFRSDQSSVRPREGLKALRRVVDIYQAQDNVDQADLLKAKSSLGDWYLTTGRRSRGLETYENAVIAAREAGLSDAAINKLYAKPEPLTTTDQPEGSNRIGLQRKSEFWSSVMIDKLDGSIIFEFDVNERGFPKNIRVVEDTIGRARMVNMLRTWVAAVVYRPKFENGEAVVTYGLRREFEF